MLKASRSTPPLIKMPQKVCFHTAAAGLRHSRAPENGAGVKLRPRRKSAFQLIASCRVRLGVGAGARLCPAKWDQPQPAGVDSTGAKYGSSVQPRTLVGRAGSPLPAAIVLPLNIRPGARPKLSSHSLSRSAQPQFTSCSGSDVFIDCGPH